MKNPNRVEAGKRVAERLRREMGEQVYAQWIKDTASKGGKAKNPNKGFGSMSKEKHIEASRRGGQK